MIIIIVIVVVVIIIIKYLLIMTKIINIPSKLPPPPPNLFFMCLETPNFITQRKSNVIAACNVKSLTSNNLYRGWQGCALTEPGGPWCPPFPLRGPENVSFFHTNHILSTIDFTGSETWLGSKKKTHNQRMVTLQTGTKELGKIGKLFVSILTKINPNGAVFFFKDVSILSREET